MNENQFQVWIDGKMPGRNEAENAARNNRFTGAALKKRWTQRVELAAIEKKPPGWRPMERYHVSCRWYEKTARRDPDNFTAAIKYILDGLQAAGIVPNDGFKNVLSIKHDWICDGKTQGVLVFLQREPE